MYPAAKYSSRYANNPWITSEMMMAFGMVVFGSFVSAARAVQLSKPTRIRIASVDWTSTPLNECGLTTSHAPLNDHAAACCRVRDAVPDRQAAEDHQRDQLDDVDPERRPR